MRSVHKRRVSKGTVLPTSSDSSSHEVWRVDGEVAVLDWIQQGGVSTWRYRMHRPGVLVAIFVLLGCLGGMGALVFGTGLHHWIQWLALSLMVASFGYVGFSLLRWIRFRHESYVAMSKTELLIGRGSSGTVIPRSYLSQSTVLLDDVQTSSVSGSLPIRLPDETVRIHLVGPLANMMDMDLLMHEILQDIAAKESDGRTTNL